MHFNYAGNNNYKEHNAFMYPILLKYLDNIVKGKKTADFFKKENIKSIAIYGLGEMHNLGEIFFRDIINSDITIEYLIDRYGSADNYLGTPLIKISDIKFPLSADAVVLTPVYYMNEIIENLVKAGIPLEKIIPITEIIFGL